MSLHCKYSVSEIYTGPQRIPALEKTSANDTAKKEQWLRLHMYFLKEAYALLRGRPLYCVQ